MRSTKSKDPLEIKKKLSPSCSTTAKICGRNWMGINALHVASKLCNEELINVLNEMSHFICYEKVTFWGQRNIHELYSSKCNGKKLNSDPKKTLDYQLEHLNNISSDPNITALVQKEYKSLYAPELRRWNHKFDSSNLEKLLGGEHGHRALYQAVEVKNIHVVKLLVLSGSDINAKDDSSKINAFQLSIDINQGNITNILFNSGAIIDEDVARWIKKHHKNLIELIPSSIRKIIDPTQNEKDYNIDGKYGKQLSQHLKYMDKQDGLHKAIIDRNLNAAENLLKKGIRISWLIATVASTGYIDGVALLLNYKVNVDEKASVLNLNSIYNYLIGYTGLYWAAEEGKYEMVEFLLNKGAKVDTKNGPFRWTALHIAAYKGHLNIVKLLVERKASVSIYSGVPCSWCGQTALTIAAEEGKSDVVDYLLRNGGDSNDIKKYLAGTRNIEIQNIYDQFISEETDPK